MVVLEDNNSFSSMNNQYFQQDYLSPLPTTLDTKKSPLALLAQTCSQIGADTPLSKSLVSALEKSRKPANENTVSPPISAREKSEKTPVHSTINSTTDNKLVFKPYEHNVLSKKTEDQSSLKVQSLVEDKKGDGPTSCCGSISPPTNLSRVMNTETSITDVKEKSATPSGESSSPSLKTDAENLQEHIKDIPFNSFKPAILSTGVSTNLEEKFSTFCPTSRFENANPAFRPPFPGGPLSTQHSAMFSMRDPGASVSSYLNYSRTKTVCGDDPEVVLPACKDPYCTGCQFNLTNQFINKGSCPSGCTQCDHQKYRYAMAMSLFPPGPYAAYTQFGHSQICNWILGDTYCGKRFLTSEELLQHLQTHTNGADFGSLVTSSASPLINSNFGSTIFSTPLHRPGYSNSLLNPLSTSRYHPYGKPIMPISLPPYEYSVFNPMPLSYYSAYSAQGRSDATAVHL